MRYVWPVVLSLLLLACDFPRDAGGTWKRIQQSKSLRVGVVERPPWVVLEDAEPSGLEPRIMKAWAAELGATVEWRRGAESTLIDALHARQIDVLVGGFSDDTVWATRAAPSQPYFHATVVIAVPATSPPPKSESDLHGRAIAHVARRPDLAARIAELDARPEARVQPLGTMSAVYRFEAHALGLTPSNLSLADEDHIILVSQGESRLLFELDRFLARNGRRLIAAKSPP